MQTNKLAQTGGFTEHLGLPDQMLKTNYEIWGPALIRYWVEHLCIKPGSSSLDLLEQKQFLIEREICNT